MDPQQMERELESLRALVRDQGNILAGIQVGSSVNSSASASDTTASEVDEGPWVPYYAASNPHAQRPNNTSDKPQHFELYASPTFRLLEDKTTAMKYEFRTLEAVLSYLFDSQYMAEDLFPQLLEFLLSKRSCAPGTEAEGISVSDEDGKLDGFMWALAALPKSLKEIYTLLTQRGDYIRLKTKFDYQPGGITAAERLLLTHLEIKMHGMADGLALVDSKINNWMTDYGDRAASATASYAAKLFAKGTGSVGKGRGKDRWEKGGSKGAKGRNGKGGEKGQP